MPIVGVNLQCENNTIITKEKIENLHIENTPKVHKTFGVFPL
jgi:hypothetical protein